MTLARELADTAGRPQVDKNLLINGGMNVWQRSTSTSVSTDIYSTVDRFKTRVSGLGAFTISRSTDVPSAQGFGYSLKMDCTTADASPAAGDFLQIQQIIEGQNLQHLLKGTSNAKAITMSFWVKSNKTGTYIASLYDGDNTRRISKSYTIDSASTWEKKTITFPGDTSGTLDNDNGASLWVQWWLGAGSNFTSGTLATSWESLTEANTAVGIVNLADSTSNELYITGIQLEIGEAATDFQFEPYETVLRKCCRYFWYGSNKNAMGTTGNTANSTITFATALPSPLRATPTITWVSGGTTVKGGGNQASMSASTTSIGLSGQDFRVSWSQARTAGTVLANHIFHVAGTLAIEFDSEL
jgi:hypothetical protein